MAPVAALKSSRLTSLVGVLLLFTLMLVSLLFMSEATQNSDRFGQLYSVLLLFNAAGLLLLTGLMGYQVYRLVTQYRARVAGSRLTLRLVALFVVLAVVPVSVVYYFSIQFLQSGIDSWFDVRIEQALEDALELSRASLDLRMREALRQTESMARELENVSPGLAALALTQLRATSDTDELLLIEGRGRIVASASLGASIIPDRPNETVMLQVRQGNAYVALSPGKYAGLQIRAVVPIPGGGTALTEQRMLQALFPVGERINVLAESVQKAFDTYRQLAFLRTPLKNSFILTLSLVLAVSLLTAVWTAVQSARRLVAPVRDLAEGTLAVSRGRYDQRLPVTSNDELGFLVMSFNQMTRNLAFARDQAVRSQRMVERQRAYLETVLSSLSSGVLTLRHDGRLRTANKASGHILGVVREELLDRSAADVAATRPYLEPFCELIESRIHTSKTEWREEVTLFGTGGRQVLMCRGGSLLDDRGLTGHVVVFDDITALVRAQRDAAWGEVARRMAHEIKNPLTPILLASERLRHKYLKTMDPEAAKVLDRSTHTIIQQVRALQEIVDAFNEYARPPRLKLAALDLNNLVAEVVYLYPDNRAGVQVSADLSPSCPLIEADAGRIRQLLHNLIKNAIEALKDTNDGELKVSTRTIDQGSSRLVELAVEDNGPGFPTATDIFEPYVTSKTKGSGLGLAIVKKIVEEHAGVVVAESSPSGGARIIVRLPFTETVGAESAVG
jgi:PAS domain S-box-containing protein